MNKLAIIAFVCIIFSCKNHESKDKLNEKFDIKFNKEAWKDGNIHVRGRMVKNLMQSGSLKNINQDSVIKLLGKPDDKSKIILGYIVGTKDTSPMYNHLLLYIKVDSNSKKVKEFWLTD
ncbi:MAG TPA: hypothetical protein VK668_23545 [Mucilaginibacter sp.]|nr:hypothetical protein [Mucilaginibacter sp.]